jgi:hypothetical protein
MKRYTRKRGLRMTEEYDRKHFYEEDPIDIEQLEE